MIKLEVQFENSFIKFLIIKYLNNNNNNNILWKISFSEI